MPSSTLRSSARGPHYACVRVVGGAGAESFPIALGQQPTVSRHRPSPWHYNCAYPPFGEVQLEPNQTLVPSFETSSKEQEILGAAEDCVMGNKLHI